jgi:hypothetical protein
MSLDIPSGSEFPDLDKAGLNLNLTDLIKGIQKEDRELFQAAQDKKKELNKQRAIDLQSFWGSQSGAIERGNANACDSRNILSRIGTAQARNTTPINLLSDKPVKPYGKGKDKINLPRSRKATPSRGDRSSSPSLRNFTANQTLSSSIDPKKYRIDQIEPTNYPEKATRNIKSFAKAQSGDRGTSIGDRAIVFTANGTPMYGDSYLDKNAQENLSANQAVSNLPISKIPSKIESNNPISAKGLQQQPRANVAPKSDTVGNMLVLGGIAAAITAVLFFFQQVLVFVQMILQISSVTSTITNIAGSFVAILNNLASLFGLGEGVVDPLSKTFDSILNNTFGKEKVDYVKYQFAKVSSAFVAGQNLINKVRGLDNTIGKVTEKTANNTSFIGNALKAMQMIGGEVPWMHEDNKVNPGISKLGDSLESVSGLASSLNEITEDVKSFKETQEDLDKQQQESEEENKKNTDKATETNSDKEIPDLDIIAGLK